MRNYVALAAQEAERLRSDEILQRFARKFAGRDVVRPRTVTDFLGEQRVAAFGLLTRQYEMRRFPEPPSQANLDQLQAALGLALLRVPPFLWTHEMRMLAVNYEVPRHVIGPESFPHRAMWWTWETALSVQGSNEGHGDAMLIFRTSWLTETFPDVMQFAFDDGWMCLSFGSDDGRGAGAFVHADWVMPDGAESTQLGEHVVLLGMSAFLNSHFVEVTKRRPVDENKRWRGRQVGDPASLNVITLRSSVREAVAMERGEGPQWKQRWLVRGHLRAQWYPSLKSHKILWIAPYLKGPEGAPLKVPIYRVAR